MAKPTPIRGLTARASLRELGPRVLLARLGDIDKHAPALPDADAVHDMRVAMRRLRAALRLFQLREHEREAKALQDALGDVRDVQLQIEWLRGRDDALATKRQKLLAKALRALPQAVKRFRAHPLPEVLLHGHLGGGKARKVLRKEQARFDERRKAALRSPTPRAMHEVRKSVKKLRYLHELMPFAARHALRKLAPLQQALGELHDVDVRMTFLKSRPDLMREQREARERLAKVVLAELKR